ELFVHLLFQLHEAIMREESVEYEEGVILQEFRKGFKLGERLLRPAMVKVSAGPGPEKPVYDDPAMVEDSVAPQKVKEAEDDGFDDDNAE
ncbi:Os02g0612000, partial [Oryza sativa Japonica Group]